jgi:adenylate cyclase class 1
MSAESFKSGTIGQLSSESSGTAQRYLLLDEFYRTGLLVEGRPPLWWLVPLELEHDYDEFISTMVEHRGYQS